MLSTAIAYGCAAKRRNGAALPVHLKQVRRSGKTLRLSASQPNQKLTRSVRASVLNGQLCVSCCVLASVVNPQFYFAVQGNTFLKNGDVNKALECYNTALSVCDDDQQCALLVMRGTALLQRAYDCK
jgi:predicted RNA polymerase sigma factor